MMSSIRVQQFISAVLPTLLLGLTVFGCTWPGPHIQPNREVAARFESLQLYPGYQYYISGTVEDPRAVAALTPGYKLDAPGWQAVEMTPGELEQWIRAMKKDPYVEYNVYPDGAFLRGFDGEIVGYYYSVWEFPLVKMPDEKTIRMIKPADNYRVNNIRRRSVRN